MRIEKREPTMKGSEPKHYQERMNAFRTAHNVSPLDIFTTASREKLANEWDSLEKKFKKIIREVTLENAIPMAIRANNIIRHSNSSLALPHNVTLDQETARLILYPDDIRQLSIVKSEVRKNFDLLLSKIKEKDLPTQKEAQGRLRSTLEEV